MKVMENSKNELIPQRSVTAWRMCINYRKLNKATNKDHIPLPLIDEMLESAPTSFQRCMMSMFLDMIGDIMEVFMDDLSVHGKTFDHFLRNLDKVL
jgi:hypothetical protein